MYAVAAADYLLLLLFDEFHGLSRRATVEQVRVMCTHIIFTIIVRVDMGHHHRIVRVVCIVRAEVITKTDGPIETRWGGGQKV